MRDWTEYAETAKLAVWGSPAEPPKVEDIKPSPSPALAEWLTEEHGTRSHVGRKSRFDDDTRAEVVRRRLNGEPTSILAAEYGASMRSIQQWVAKAKKVAR